MYGFNDNRYESVNHPRGFHVARYRKMHYITGSRSLLQTTTAVSRCPFDPPAGRPHVTLSWRPPTLMQRST
jgi:hypothetical protein